MMKYHITTGVTEVDGFKLAYRREGTGQPCIVIGSATYYPRTFADDLRAHLELIFTDHRGFAQAAPPIVHTDQFELDQLIDDIERLRIALGLDQVIVLGHSGHGYMALEYAKRYATHVSHAVLLATSPNATADAFGVADRYLHESVCPERKALLAKNLQAQTQEDGHSDFIARILAYSPVLWYQHDFDARALWQDVTIIPEMFAHVWGHVFPKLDITNGLDAMDRPVLIALGRYDYWVPPHLWEAYRSHFHDLTVRVFEQSGHHPQYEQQNDFERELLSWLDSKKS